MDPEQVYQEVLQEEQGKGSPAPVAEARAKAARVRAEHGSPHPKEAKWWPGAQPHLEGGEADEGEEEAAEEEAVEEEPAAEEPAAEAAPEPEPAPAPSEQPAQEPAAAAAPAGEASAATPAAVQPEPVAAAAPAAPAAPTGVTHGTATGNRMRPEDGVATTAQLDGQQAMYQRRKLIDELIATGTPAITAEETGKPRAPFLAILYILIPLIAVLVVVSRDDDGGTAEAGAHGGEAVEQTEGGEGGGGEGEGGGGEAGSAALEIVAVNIAFDKDTIDVPAGEETTLALDNQDDGTDHNVSIYENQEDGIAKANAIFEGEIFPGVETVVYDLPALEAGEYYFQCDVHPNMAGTVNAT